MKSRLYLVSFVCLFVFSACWKDVWENIDIENPVLKIHTMLVPDSVIKLRLNATSYLNGMSFRELNQQSEVRLWVNDEFKESLRVEHDAEWEYFYFISDYHLRETDRVRLEARCAGYPDAWAETEIPSMVPIDTFISVLHKDTVTKRIWASCEFQFTDIPAEKNYYAFSIYPYFDYPDSLLENNYLVYNYYPSHLYLTDDPVFKYIPTTIEYLLGEEEEKGTALFFDDSTIDGEKHSIRFSLDFTSPYGGGLYDEGQFPDTLKLVLNFCSESLSGYYSSISEWASRGMLVGNLTDVGLADPVSAYSNVHQGIGLVWGQAVSVWENTVTFSKDSVPE